MVNFKRKYKIQKIVYKIVENKYVNMKLLIIKKLRDT